MNLAATLNEFKDDLLKKSPEIAVGVGIAGFIFTAISAAAATPKALKRLEERKQEKVRRGKEGTLTAVETVKAAAPCYIPSIVSGIVSTSLIIFSSKEYLKRNAALIAAYNISEKTLSTYKEKVVQTIGEKKEKAIRDEIDKDTIRNNPVSQSDIIMTTGGQTLCYEDFGGRYFMSDMQTLRSIQNNLNDRLRQEMDININDFYYEVGLKNTDAGDVCGWHVDHGPILFNFSSQLTDDGRPCLVVSFDFSPSSSEYI